MTSLLIASYLAGLITVLTPCVLPFLPVILGSSLGRTNYVRPIVITASLSLSIIVFGVIFQLGTRFLGLSREFWISAGACIITLFGVFTLFPNIWEGLSQRLKFSSKGGKLLDAGSSRSDLWGAVLIGLALGPVFSGCSPTFVLILSIIVPASLVEGIFYLCIYVLGISTLLLLITIFGQKLVAKLRFTTNPHGWFRKLLGLILVIMGVAIFFGFDKSFETFLLKNIPAYEHLTNVEIQIKDLIDQDSL